MREVSAIMARSGAARQYFPDAVSHHDQIHGQFSTSSNRYGGGEAPDKTLGLQDIRTRLRPFFCPCTVDVSHLKLGVADDGSLHRLGENAVAIESSDDDVDIDDYDFESDEDAGHLTEVSDSAGSRIGKIKAIKRLGGFYLSAGGGIDRSWNGQGFPGYRVLVPELRSCSAVNSGVTTSHHVRFWPSLKPVTHQQTGFPTDATMAGALRDMSRTSEEALVHPRRFGALSIPELVDQKLLWRVT